MNEPTLFAVDEDVDPDAVVDLKRCRLCQQDRPLSAFALKTAAADGRFHSCRSCVAVTNRYVTHYRAAQLAELLQHQGGRCAACGEHLDPAHAVMDHPHSPAAMVDALTYRQAITGALHISCNLAIGHVGDNPTRARALAAYIEQTR